MTDGDRPTTRARPTTPRAPRTLSIAGSVDTARRIAHRRYQTAARRRATVMPFVVIIALLGAVNVWMFLLPMAHRM